MFEYGKGELQDIQEQVVSLVPGSRQEEWAEDDTKDSSSLQKVKVKVPAWPQANAVQVQPLPPFLHKHQFRDIHAFIDCAIAEPRVCGGCVCEIPAPSDFLQEVHPHAFHTPNHERRYVNQLGSAGQQEGHSRF